MKKIFVKKEERIPFTREGYAKVLEEKEALLKDRPDAVKHLSLARAMGDLRENGYYKAARARLSFIDARLKRVERLVKLGKIVESSGTGIVDIGSRVVVTDGQKEYRYTVVGGYESDPAKFTISYVSPMGKALMGKREQDKIEFQAPNGIKIFILLKVS